jgi:hypothetical protein
LNLIDESLNGLVSVRIKVSTALVVYLPTNLHSHNIFSS